jgi:acyl carrier protein
LIALIQRHAATILGHSGPTTIDPNQPFKDHGFDSLTAVELRNRLNTATGLHLPTTTIFDHPTPTTLASHLRALMAVESGPPTTGALEYLDLFESALPTIDGSAEQRDMVVNRLEKVIRLLRTGPGSSSNGASELDLTEVTYGEIFDVIDRELGIDADPLKDADVS